MMVFWIRFLALVGLIGILSIPVVLNQQARLQPTASRAKSVSAPALSSVQETTASPQRQAWSAPQPVATSP